MEPMNDSRWDWITCNYNLKSEYKNKQIMWNLSPSIILTNPQVDGPDPNVKLFIDTEKSLEYSHDIGWSWHKSWNLPNISVRLEIRDPRTGELLLAPKNLYAHIFAVKAVLDHSDNFHLVDVGIRGTNKIELIDGHAFFTALKFSSTSYNNEGVKFHLVLSLYIMGEEDTVPKILNSTISPPIFVDSRKQARDTNVLLEKKMSSFVEPFPSEALEKMFIKRENKRKNDVEIQIQNDFEGLFNYLTAPNIRHKVKHPIFLCLKFSSCVKLYYNKDLIQDVSMSNIVQLLQKRIYDDHQYKRAGSANQKLKEKMFLLIIKETSDTFKNKKIIEAVEPLQCQSLGILYSISQQIPNCFVEIVDTNDLLNMYKKTYTNLFSHSKINKSFLMDDNAGGKDSSSSNYDDDDSDEDDDDDDDDDESQSDNGSEKNTKKKVNKGSNFNKVMGESGDKKGEKAAEKAPQTTTQTPSASNVKEPAKLQQPTTNAVPPANTDASAAINTAANVAADGKNDPKNAPKDAKNMKKGPTQNDPKATNPILPTTQNAQTTNQSTTNSVGAGSNSSTTTDPQQQMLQQLLANPNLTAQQQQQLNLLLQNSQNNPAMSLLLKQQQQQQQQMFEQMQKTLGTQGAQSTTQANGASITDQNANLANATQGHNTQQQNLASLLLGNLNQNNLSSSLLQNQTQNQLNLLNQISSLTGVNNQQNQNTQNKQQQQTQGQQQQQQQQQPQQQQQLLMQLLMQQQNKTNTTNPSNLQIPNLNNFNLPNANTAGAVNNTLGNTQTTGGGQNLAGQGQQKNQTIESLMAMLQNQNQNPSQQNTQQQQGGGRNQLQQIQNMLAQQQNILANQLKNPLGNIANLSTNQLNLNSLFNNMNSQGTNAGGAAAAAGAAGNMNPLIGQLASQQNNLLNLAGAAGGNNLGFNQFNNLLKGQVFPGQGQNNQLQNLQLQSLLQGFGGVGGNANLPNIGGNANFKQEHIDDNIKKEGDK